MRLTTRTDYALRMLLYLALHPERVVPIPEIADAYGISHHHLAKVGQELAQRSWVESLRGKSGGLRLAAGTGGVGVGEVVRHLEGWELVECFAPEGGACPIVPACVIRRALGEAREAFLAALDRYSVSDLASSPRKLVRLFEVADAGGNASVDSRGR